MTRGCLPMFVLCGTLMAACGETQPSSLPDAGHLPPQGEVPTCTDARVNGTESDVDCGGTCPARCVPGKICYDDGDCESAVCRAALCQVPTCEDGVKNGTESDVDCGGGTGCGPCPVGGACGVGGDCESGVCTDGACVGASCTDGVKNQSETDVDCGGACPEPRCAEGSGCAQATDCASGVCMGDVCAAISCTDGVRNGNESDVDCGGGGCPGCAAGLQCALPASCASGVCSNGVCQAPSCDDGVRNGSETGTDCGGTCPAQCPAGEGCAGPADCLSRVCTGGLCEAPTCTDGVLNGTESDIDCGGTCPQQCGWGQTCGSPLDCVAGVACAGGTCNGCTAGLGDCDGDPTNGCETTVTNDLQHCGGCGVTCSGQNMTPSCLNGACGGSCLAGFFDCNGDTLADGCEVDAATHPAHCGGCGMACSGANVAQPACSGGSCSGTCAPGFFDCDGDLRTNGCEVNGGTDPVSCGGCGIAVDDGDACTTDACVNGVVTNTPIPGCGAPTTCPHSSCETGAALSAQLCSYPGANNNCVANVCAQDAFCCSNIWDTLCRQAAMDPSICPTGLSSPNTGNFTCNCAHSFCSTGAATQPLIRSCDPCVKRICELDPFCCNNDWDDFCVQQVPVACNITCP